MSNVPGDRRYTATHEWLRRLPDGTVEIGITDHAQEQLGDLVYVELPEVGRAVAAGEACMVVESVKAASDVYTPVAGTITATNDAIAGDPGIVNREPFAGGWLVRLKPAAADADAGLLDAAGYQAALEAAGH